MSWASVSAATLPPLRLSEAICALIVLVSFSVLSIVKIAIPLAVNWFTAADTPVASAGSAMRACGFLTSTLLRTGVCDFSVSAGQRKVPDVGPGGVGSGRAERVASR